MRALPQQFGRYGLEINREKTKLVDFLRPRWGYDPRKHGPKQGTFTFLGFTQYWGKTFKNLTWAKYEKLLKTYRLPRPKIMQSWV